MRRRRRGDESRWFPGQESSQRRVGGWLMSDGSRWSAEDVESGVDLASWQLAGGDLTVRLTLVGDGDYLWVFPGIADVQIDGHLRLDVIDGTPGWEVFDTDMVTAAKPRADGKLVYVIYLPDALLCWASEPADPPPS